MTNISPTINRFITEFGSRFKEYLQTPPIKKELENRNIPHYTRYFTICEGEMKFSDWDLHCKIDLNKTTLTVLGSMDNFIKTFSNFSCVGNFIGAGIPQFMAFMPKESFAPFFDIHIEEVSEEMREKYYHEILDFETAKQETRDWLVLTWLRKVKNKSEDTDSLREVWLPRWLPPEDYRALINNPEVFCLKYFKDRGYDKIVEFLSCSS